MLYENMPNSGTSNGSVGHSVIPDMKRKNRRAKKGRNKNVCKMESVLKGIKKVNENKEEVRLLQDTLRSEILSSECKKSMVKRRSGGEHRRNQVFLRPTNVPLLNAPKNSTQFIIDDHENSNLFWNFHDSENEDIDPSNPAGFAVFTGQYFNHQEDQMSPDDDSYWAEYSERDFQTVYETAHQEKIAEWSKKKLVGEISYLEKRQRNLLNSLSLVDPKMYLHKLQSELLSLQEDNRKLRLDLVRSNSSSGSSLVDGKEVPDSTSLTDPGSSSSSSSEDEEPQLMSYQEEESL
ncbi:uncharacterized protein [Lepeophtheirus salmonis]|nr:uncharacterized protein LOC121119930 isoform X2 [Lepeophtheirus salmonis]